MSSRHSPKPGSHIWPGSSLSRDQKSLPNTKAHQEASSPHQDIWAWEAGPTVLEVPAGFGMWWYKGQAAAQSALPYEFRSTSFDVGIPFSQSPACLPLQLGNKWELQLQPTDVPPAFRRLHGQQSISQLASGCQESSLEAKT